MKISQITVAMYVATSASSYLFNHVYTMVKGTSKIVDFSKI